MKYVGDLITEVKRETDSDTVADGESVDAKMLAYVREGQDRCNSILSQKKVSIFDVTEIIPLVANQEAYNLSTRTLTSTRVKLVQFSKDRTVENYTTVYPVGYWNRDSQSIASPFQYHLIGKQILIPPPESSAGSLRIICERKVDDLALRIATVASITYLGYPTSQTRFETIVVADDTILDETEMGASDYFCAVDRFGRVMAYALEKSSYTAVSKTLALYPHNLVTQSQTDVYATVSTGATSDTFVVDSPNALRTGESVYFVDTSSQVQTRTIVSAYPTGVILSAATTLAAGAKIYRLISAGDYLVAGQYATTHSQLPDTCERHIKSFAKTKVLIEQGKMESSEEGALMSAIEQDLTALFSQTDRVVWEMQEPEEFSDDI